MSRELKLTEHLNEADENKAKKQSIVSGRIDLKTAGFGTIHTTPFLKTRDMPMQGNLSTCSSDPYISKTYLPIEIQIKLGLSRLYLKQVEDASTDFECLFAYDINEYFDVYVDVCEALSETGNFREALRFYLHMLSVTGFNELTVVRMGMAYAYRRLHQYGEAEKYYMLVASDHPQHLESRRALAEMYEENGQREKAVDWVHEIISIKKALDEKLELTVSADVTPLIPNTTHSLDRMQKSRGLRISRVITSLGQESEGFQSAIVARFDKLRALKPEGLQLGQYINLARQLYNDFSSVKRFFPATGRSVVTRRVLTKNIEDRMISMAETLADRLLPSNDYEDGEKPEISGEGEGEEWCGILFADWFEMFMRVSNPRLVQTL